jgi:hypothetical protein
LLGFSAFSDHLSRLSCGFHSPIEEAAMQVCFGRTAVDLAVGRAVYALLRAWRKGQDRRQAAAPLLARQREGFGT